MGGWKASTRGLISQVGYELESRVSGAKECGDPQKNATVRAACTLASDWSAFPPVLPHSVATDVFEKRSIYATQIAPPVASNVTNLIRISGSYRDILPDPGKVPERHPDIRLATEWWPTGYNLPGKIPGYPGTIGHVIRISVRWPTTEWRPTGYNCKIGHGEPLDKVDIISRLIIPGNPLATTLILAGYPAAGYPAHFTWIFGHVGHHSLLTERREEITCTQLDAAKETNDTGASTSPRNREEGISVLPIHLKVKSTPPARIS